LSNEFYTKIPHDFGKMNAPVLQDDEMVKQKMEMLEALMEMEVAQKLGASAAESTRGSELSEADRVALNNYDSLNCGLTPVDPKR
jgi:Poly(ADP-ribose) polymerase, regulatory domain